MRVRMMHVMVMLAIAALPASARQTQEKPSASARPKRTLLSSEPSSLLYRSTLRQILAQRNQGNHECVGQENLPIPGTVSEACNHRPDEWRRRASQALPASTPERR